MNAPELPTADLLRQPHGNKVYILALARALPGLARKLQGMTPERFDIDDFMASSGPWASSEKVLAKFIASVWNPREAAHNGWICDVTDVASSINFEDRLVILHWIAKPIYP